MCAKRFAFLVTTFTSIALSPLTVSTQVDAPPRLVRTTAIVAGAPAIRINARGDVLISSRGVAYFWSRELGLESIRYPTPAPDDDVFYTHARDLNNHGDVVGEILSLRGYYEPFFWSTTGGIQLLSPEAIIEVAPATAINDDGEAVGSDDPWQWSYRWSAASGLERRNPLGATVSYCTSSALDISRWGDSVGTSTVQPSACDDSAGNPMHAYFQPRSGAAIDLGTLGGTFSVGVDVNDTGHVVGTSRTAGSLDRAFVWSATGGMQDLGTLGGRWSSALVVNNLGQVAGVSETSTGAVHAFVWSPASGLRDIGPGVPSAMNDLGQVVGTFAAGGSSSAWMWSSGDGRTVFAQDARVADINDRGEAVGVQGVLTPPEVATLWQLRITPDETLNWYEAQIKVLTYGRLLRNTHRGNYAAWLRQARAAWRKGDERGVSSWLRKLRGRLGEP